MAAPRPTFQLKVGDEAPNFTLPATGKKGAGKGEIDLKKGLLPPTVTLSQFRGKKNVVLAFYPAAFTPV